MIRIPKRYRLYPTENQKSYLSKNIGAQRWLWNFALDKIKNEWEVNKKRINATHDVSSLLPQLKKDPQTQWLNEVNSTSLIHTLRNLDSAFKNFFRRIKQGKSPGYPKFKNKYKGRKSFAFHQGYNIDEKSGILNIPKCKGIKIEIHRPLNGILKTCTIINTPSGKYYASVLIEEDKELPKLKKVSEKTTIGIDMGIRVFATISSGEKSVSEDIVNPHIFEKKKKQLRRAQKSYLEKF